MTTRHLIVQADDFGMCAPVTDGILACHGDGVVTQASVMPPAPDANRAMWLARSAGLPLGVHLTLGCEWTGLRYHPLTPAPSLRDHDGAFLPGVAELRVAADPEEAAAEARAQVAAVRVAGIRPTHMESHIGVFDADLVARLSAELGLPSRDPVPGPGRTLPLDSLWHLSTRPPATKLADLVAHVEALPPGVHMIVAHPAVDHPLLRTLCEPSSRRWRWARDIRVSDLAALRSPAFGEACATAGVVLTTVGELAEQGRDGFSSVVPTGRAGG